MYRRKKIKQRPIKDRFIDVLEKYTALLEQELRRRESKKNHAITAVKEQWRQNLN
jgi:hypothetical protein